MSKKIMKRSLALGALMAFVITGSAWAGITSSGNVAFRTDGTIKNSGGVLNVVGPVTFTAAVSSGIRGVIEITGGTTNITDATFKNITFDAAKNKGTIHLYSTDGAPTLNLYDVTFENIGYKDGNFINDQSTGATININGTNYFTNYTGRGIYGGSGTITFMKGSDTTFTTAYNANDITLRNNGKLIVDSGATVTLNGKGIEGYSESSVYIYGLINGKIAGKSYSTSSGAGTIGVYFAGGTWNVTGKSAVKGITVGSEGGKVSFVSNGHLDTEKVSGSITLTETSKTADDLNTAKELSSVAAKLGVKDVSGANAKVVMNAGNVVGETIGVVSFSNVAEHGYYHGAVYDVTEKINPANQAISDAAIGMKLHWRAHVNDMNKRMGELRDANGEHGVWTRMVRGESEYKNVKAQYNQYQLGYDEKLSVDKRWTVGAAVTFSEGDSSYGYGSTEDKSTAFAIYGSKLNNDGTFVDLIARYAHLESDVDDQAGKGSYSANGMSVSAEVGKRIQQGNGLWIEPQAELTYGTIDSAEYKLGTKTVEVGDMDSLIGRIGFRIGKDIEKGNVYARASYLYDFEGETENAFRNDTARRSFNEDLGGGWWEVGVGANINLSKATYVYADVEKTFGGEVDTNWQWNLGVRYSF